MNTSLSDHGADPAKRSAITIGVLVPLTPPGWVEAGRDLLAGLELAAHDVNAAGGVAGHDLALVVRDSAGDPERALDAVADFDRLGALAVAGEYHSLVARAVADRAEAIGLPFVCSSAVLDTLTDHPANWVARIAPPQTRGWRRYAAFLLAAGHRRIAVAIAPGAYWQTGARIVREALAEQDGILIDLQVETDLDLDKLAASDATALLVLVGAPQPAQSIVAAIRGDIRFAGLLIGAPAGQPELPGWEAALGELGAAIPFLRYLPDQLPPLGKSVAARLRAQLGREPSFVAFEGYDSILVAAAALRGANIDRARVNAMWPHIRLEGTRGVLSFHRTNDSSVWQNVAPPIQVADRDPHAGDRFRTLAGAHLSEAQP